MYVCMYIYKMGRVHTHTHTHTYINIYYNTSLGTYEYYSPLLEQGAYTRLLASVHFSTKRGPIFYVQNVRRSFYNDEIWYWKFHTKI
jgi:hypothetical protein